MLKQIILSIILLNFGALSQSLEVVTRLPDKQFVLAVNDRGTQVLSADPFGNPVKVKTLAAEIKEIPKEIFQANERYTAQINNQDVLLIERDYYPSESPSLYLYFAQSGDYRFLANITSAINLASPKGSYSYEGSILNPDNSILLFINNSINHYDQYDNLIESVDLNDFLAQ